MLGEMATSTAGRGSAATACWASSWSLPSSVVRIGGLSFGGVDASWSVGWPSVPTRVTDHPAAASIFCCHTSASPLIAGDDRSRFAVSSAPCSETVTPGIWASWSRTTARSGSRSRTTVTTSSWVPANCSAMLASVMVGANCCSSGASAAADAACCRVRVTTPTVCQVISGRPSRSVTGVRRSLSSLYWNDTPWRSCGCSTAGVHCTRQSSPDCVAVALAS